MTEPEKTKPRAASRKTTADKPKVKPVCHIHDKVDDWEVDDIRANVCVNEEDFTEFEGKHYCLFHLPTKDKDIEKFNEIFEARLDKTERKAAEIEAEFHDDKEKQDEVKIEENVVYDFSFVWFPTDVNLSDRKFISYAYFKSATFSSVADFRRTVFTLSVDFDFAKFVSSAVFISATFASTANFRKVTFKSLTNFRAAIFKSFTSFTSAVFTSYTIFRSVIFKLDIFFTSATFSAEAHFEKVKFSKNVRTYFDKTTFEKDAFFDRARFKNDVLFNSVIFGKESNIFFRGAFFAKNADFQYCSSEGYLRFNNLRQGKESKFDFQEAAFEKANRVSFHTVKLQPNWFVNVDSRKFVFTDIDWGKSIEWQSERNYSEKLKFAGKCFISGLRQVFKNSDEIVCENIAIELNRLAERGINEQKKRLLEIACRQLAVNAEENNRYEEAAKLRYMAMETRRLENQGVRRLLNLHWVYKWSSGYGESWRRAFVTLLGLLLLFAVLYASPLATFDYGEKRKELPDDAVERQIFDIAETGARFRDMNFGEGIIHSLYVSALQRPEPKAEGFLTRLFVILQTIFVPLQAALLALAIRRKFMR